MSAMDRLDIEITASVDNAIKSLDRLSNNLSRIQSALSGVGSSGLGSFVTGMNQLSSAMVNFNNSGVKTQDFTRLAKNIGTIANLNNGNLANVANNISQLSVAFSGLSNIGANANNIVVLVNAISKLGNKSVATAMSNMPKLTNSLNQLFVVLSKSPQVSQNIINMTNALANLASQGSKVGSASNAIATGLQKTQKVADKTGRKMTSLASAFGKFYASYFLVVRGIKGLASSIESTTDYLEAYNYYTVATEKVTSEWNTSAEDLTKTLGKLSGLKIEVDAEGKGLLSESGAKNLGLNIKEITQYASQLVSVTNSLGLAGETSIGVASAFTKLAGDISSLFNIDYSQAATNLQSGLIGQSRALYKFGLDITQNTLQQYAYAEGIEKAVSEMSQAEKMQLRLLAVLDQSKVAWGDLANTIESPSNMLRQFKNNVSELGTVFGQLFIPMLQRVMPIINGVTIALKGLLVNIAGFAGIQLDLGSFGQGYTDLEEDLSGVGDAYEDVTNKTKEWKNELYGFDEIQRQSDISAPTLETDTDSTIDLSSSIQDALADYDKVWNEAFNKMESNAINISKSISKALKPIEDIFADLFSGDFEGAGENTGKLASNILNFFTDSINSIEWDKLGKDIADYINGVFKSIKGKDIAKGINAFTNMIWDTFTNMLKNVDYWEIIETIGEVLLNLDWVTIGKLYLVKKGIGLGKQLFSGLSEGFGNAFSGIGTAISGLSATTLGFGAKLGGWIAEGVQSPLMAIPAFVGSYIKGISDDYAELAKTYAWSIGEVTDEVQGYLDGIQQGLDKINNTSLTLNTNFEASDDEIESIETLAGKYFDLSEKVNLTADEQDLLNGYRDALVKANPDFEKILGDNSLRYDEQKKAIQDIIAELKNKARMESASAMITEAGKNVFEAENLVAEYKSKVEEQKKVANELDKKIKAGQKEIEEILRDINTAAGGTDEQWARLGELVALYNSATFSSQMEKMGFGDDWYGADTAIGTVTKEFNDATESAGQLNEKYHEAERLLNEVNWELDYYVGVAEGVISADMTLYDYKQKMNEEQKKLVQTSDEAAKAQEDMSNRSETANKTAVDSISNYVSGTITQMTSATQSFGNSTSGIVRNIGNAVSGANTEIGKLNVTDLKPKVGTDVYNSWFNLGYKLGERFNDGWKAIKSVIATTLDSIYNYVPTSTRQELSPNLTLLVNSNSSSLASSQTSAYDYFLAQSGRQSQSQQSEQSTVFNITIGGQQITDYVITDINGRTIRTGLSPLLG